METPIGPMPMVTRREVPHGPSYIPPEMTDEEKRENERKNEKLKMKSYRKRKDEVLEELVPKPSTARESRVEKSRMRSQARREKEDNDGDTINEFDDDTNSFQVMLRREQERKGKRSQEQRDRIVQKMGELRQKEEKTMSMLRELAASKGYL